MGQVKSKHPRPPSSSAPLLVTTHTPNQGPTTSERKNNSSFASRHPHWQRIHSSADIRVRRKNNNNNNNNTNQRRTEARKLSLVGRRRRRRQRKRIAKKTSTTTTTTTSSRQQRHSNCTTNSTTSNTTTTKSNLRTMAETCTTTTTKMMTTTTSTTTTTPSKAAPTRTFFLFSELTDDLKRSIVSFVADAPYEQDMNEDPKQNPTCHSTLTHTLPFVCKYFYKELANLDTYWKAALLRRIQQEPELWKDGLNRFYHHHSNSNSSNSSTDATMTTTASINNHDDDDDDPQVILQRAMDVCPNNSNNNNNNNNKSYKELYRLVLNDCLRFTGPVFCMPSPVTLGEPYGLHFFEPRYRILISDVLQNHPPSARTGAPIEGQQALFIHAHTVPLVANETPATLVQVLRAHVHPDLRADVLLLPVCHVWMEQLWIRPNSGNLVYSQTRRMGKRQLRALGMESSSSSTSMYRRAPVFLDLMENSDDDDDDDDSD